MKHLTLFGILVSVFFFWLLAPTPAVYAGTITVESAGDGAASPLNCPGASCRLCDAIAAASPGDTINFAGDYTIVLASQLTIDANMTIDGTGHAVTVSGGGNVRVFYVNPGKTATLNRLTIAHGNAGTDSGGGIYNNSGSGLTVTNCTLSENSARFGGGIYNNSGSLTVANSTLWGNSTTQGGAGICNSAGFVSVTNSTFSGNRAANGGGIGNFSGTLFLVNSTLSNNTATSFGGGVYNMGYSTSPATFNFANTIIANTPNATYRHDCYNQDTVNISWNDNNWVGDGSCSQYGANFKSGNPLLGALADNGGPTQTFALLPGSLAIGAGNDTVCTAAPVDSLDQRGVARPQGAACDIGAFESRGFTLTKTGGDNQFAPVRKAFADPLALSVTSAYAEPVDGGQVTLTAPSSGASIATPPLALTIASGAVSQGVTANGTIGGPYNVTASATGASGITFALTNAAPDLSVSKTDGGQTSVPGGVVMYQATVQNSGNWKATGVVLTETVPANTTFDLGNSNGYWSCPHGSPAGTVCTLGLGEFASGASNSWAIFAVSVVNPVPAGVTQIANTVTIGDDGLNGPDSNPANNTGSDTTPVDAAPDLVLTKSNGRATVAPGQTVIYTLTYTNTGNQNATGVTLTETVPVGTTFVAGSSAAGWSCADGALAGTPCTLTVGNVAGGGGNGSRAFAVTIPQGVVGQISNTAAIADDGSNGADPTPGNNSATDTDPLVPSADLQVTKTAVATVDAGGLLQYTMTVTNNGPSHAQSLTLTDTLPAGMTFVAQSWHSGPAFTLSHTGNSITDTLGTLSAGASSAIVVSAQVAVDVANNSALRNTANISAVTSDPNTANNASTTVTTASNPGTTTTLASAQNPAAFGQSVVFTATVTSAGGVPGGTVEFRDNGATITGCAAQALAAGQATCATAALTMGTHTITALYSGDFDPSTGTLSPDQQVCGSAITVANNADSGAGSLRQAIVDACVDGTITFGDAYTITLASELVIGKGLTIDGAGHHVTVSGNHATRVFFIITSGPVTLNGLNIIDGGGGASGGGIWNEVALAVSNSTFSGNSGYGGGAIRNSGGTLAVTNSTFVSNTAAIEGGGIANYGTLAVTNSTFSGNRATGSVGGGIYNNTNNGAALHNVLIAKSTAGGNCGGYAFTGGSANNLSDDATCSGGFTQSANLRLGVLGDHGGATPTVPLLSDSPAIDAGDSAICAAAPVNGKDQRGQDRNDDRCDIGAFELKFADSDTVTRAVAGAGTYTFGPTMVTIVVTNMGGCLTGIAVQRYNVNHPNATAPLQTGHWWRITPTPGACTGFDVSVTLPADFTPGIDDKVCRHTGSGWDCAVASYTSNTLTRAGVTAFSDWAVGRNVDPTAVTLLSLSADSQGFLPVVGGVGMLVLGAAVSRWRKRR